MRTFRVQVNDKSYMVSVDQIHKGKFRASVEGTTLDTEAVSDHEVTAWLVRSDGETIHAHAKTLPGDKVDVWISDMPFHTSIQILGVGGYAIAPEPQRIAASSQVSALMPGRVTSILVSEGELVSEGSPLLILEAMKMQNEVTSPLSGRVKSVLVSEGATVKKDAVLMIIDTDSK